MSSLTNVAAYGDTRWMELFHDLATYSYDDHIFKGEGPPDVYRKGWEWTQTIWGLEQLNMIHPEHRAIGVGAGRECVIFWLGDRLRQVVASDLYGGAHWSDTGGREADPAVLEDPQQFCPRPIRNDVIEFKTLDGTDLGIYPADTFDFAWSLSSIEHFGSHERAADAVRELARVVRPGGIVAVATEYLLLPEQSHAEYFNRQDLEDYVIKAAPDLELIEPVDWSLPPAEFLVDSIVFPQGIERTRRHVVLNDGLVQWTSVMLFLRKKSR
ncbi:MAG TPA: class I SAM-dependent methyltransferase [Acidimicrobiales bacterium]